MFMYVNVFYSGVVSYEVTRPFSFAQFQLLVAACRRAGPDQR
jgi:hypothetical protein